MAMSGAKRSPKGDARAESASRVEPAPLGMPMKVCIICGCDERRPCIGAAGPREIVLQPCNADGTFRMDLDRCRWVAVDEESGRGICSRCAEKPMVQLLAEANRQ